MNSFQQAEALIFVSPRALCLAFCTSRFHVDFDSPEKIFTQDCSSRRTPGVFLSYFLSVKYSNFETFTVDFGLVQKNVVTIGTELKTKHLS